MKKRLLALTLALLTLLLLAGCGEKEPETDLAYVQGKGTLVIGVTDFPPMDYPEDGDWAGFDADMARAFAQSLGVTPIFKEIKWEDKATDLQEKEIDVVWNAMTLSSENSARMDCSLPYCRNAQVVVLAANKADGYQTEDSLRTLNFVAEDGSAGANALDEVGLSYTPVKDSETALARVADGTADACAIDLLLVNAMVGSGTNYPTLTHTVELCQEEYAVAFRQGSDLVGPLNDFLAQSYADGTTQQYAVTHHIEAYILDPNS